MPSLHPADGRGNHRVAREQVERAARLLWETRTGRLLRLERRRAAYERHPDRSCHLPALRADRQLRRARAATCSSRACRQRQSRATSLLPASQTRTALGLAERPLGPSRWGFVTTDELYARILEGQPYPVRGLVGFGANLLLAHAESRRGRAALAALDFYVHADLFMNPTAELADVVLPVASPFETEGLKIGFEVSAEAQSLVQLRQPLVEPRGEARSDSEIVFDLAGRLGLGAHFWDGDIDAAYRHQLGPSGVSLDALRAKPGGVRVPLTTRYRKYAEEAAACPAASPRRPARSSSTRRRFWPRLPAAA